MLERLTDPRFKAISQPSAQAVALTTQILEREPAPVIAEIGIGIGATSMALCSLLDHRGEAWFFDFEDRVTELAADLAAAGYTNIRTFGNSRATHDSYGWTLAMLLRRRRASGPAALFDFIYLDGAHVWHHDALATVCAKALLKPGGFLLMDDYDWTIAVSPTMRPSVNPTIRQHYTEEQIELSHVEMICSLLLDDDPHFERVPLGYRGREHRRAYRRLY
ncbi:class I SAM-dependent methyltransferase [Rhodopila sp.]|jgi:predicted O-methyltransferase YrrM|uniref:class I SAM-dependent methyltransferase n=1 Tax=Rhodopila sp. TaxID=2480087 RepID=UPI002B75D174|nr:class I SAM-dependent methyltransferase [Rhodopila sp.]HVZ10034.1 class I SAM-dependent methyltransferase [Rhodopila sp.]